MDALAGINTRATPQTERADPRQELNNAGGYTFTLDAMTRLRRFLTLGVDSGTYYVGPYELARDNADIVLELARNNTQELVAEIVTISTAGRAPRQQPTLFALAAATAFGDDDGRKLAFDAVPLVARTSTHMFQFAKYREQFAGWGRGMRRAVGAWYTRRPVTDVAFQAVKYRQRDGWSQRDVLRLAHPKTVEPTRKALFDWICGRDVPLDDLRILEGFSLAQRVTQPKMVAALVTEYGLSWEMLPDAALAEPMVWEALLEKGMPATALMRQLPRLTRLGLLAPMGAWAPKVAAQLADAERLRKARVHPVNVLVAQRTYASGRSLRGTSTWEPSRPIVDALDAGFYAAFGALEPTGKRLMLALDVSGSMEDSVDAGDRDKHGRPLPGAITCREASVALALVTASVEAQYEFVAFTAGGSYRYNHTPAVTPLAISPRQRLDDAISTVSRLPYGGTDCALPMLHALDKGIAVDAFVLLTDNESWAGAVHPHQALLRYRQHTGIDAKLIVVGMTATRFTVGDPTDAGTLNVSGFDAAIPSLISDFARGF